MKRIAVGKVVGAAIVCLVGVVGAVSAVRAGSVQNPYVELTGDLDFGGVTDDSIGIKRPDGPAEIQVKPRPGWEVDGPTNFVYESGKPIKIRVKGKDGEEIKEIWLEMVTNSCNHQVEQDSIHQVDTGIGGTNDHVLAVYHAPEVGVPVKADLEWYVTATGMHKVVVTEEPCPNCEFGHGKQPDPTWETVVPEEPFDILYTYDGSQIERDKVTYYPLGTHKLEGSAAWISEKCSRCTCRATAIREYKVCRTSVSGDKYIGLDMMDAGKNGPSGSASAEVTLELTADVSDTCQWETAPHCRFADDTMTATGLVVSVHDTGVPSATFMGERLDAKVTLKDSDGCEVADSLTHTLTVVQVDVTVDKVLEAKEETEGAWLYEIPDAANGEWTEEGTNDLREVKIEWYPKNLPDDQIIRISAPQSMLYEKKESESAYRPAKNSYTIKELGEREFWLHGHKRSGEYLGEQIEVTHDLSGARDLAKFTVFGCPYLVPDYDRKTGIDDADLEKTKRGKKVYFWANQDTWKGDDAFAGIIKTMNADNDVVNGRHDLVNLLPLALNLKDIQKEIVESGEFVIEPEGAGLKDAKVALVLAEWSNSEDVAGKDIKTFDGKNLEKSRLQKMKNEFIIPQEFVKLSSKRGCLLVMEFPKEARDECFTIRFREKGGGRTYSKSKLKIHAGNVDKMYGWCDIRKAVDGGSGTFDQSTPDWPEEEHRKGTLVFVHGYNISLDEARTWSRNVFKKLWWAGLDVGFAGVTWSGNDGQLPILGGVTPNYYENVKHAFESAQELKDQLSKLTGPIGIMAHSLGNMLVCASAQDKGLRYDKYFLLNAAVALEAFDAKTEITEDSHTRMTPKDWLKYADRVRASHWFELFGSADGRNSLTWHDRFSNVHAYINFYSTEEEVLRNGDSGTHSLLVRDYVWYNQENRKGWWPLMLHDYEGGWGFNSDYDYVEQWWAGDRLASVKHHMKPDKTFDLSNDELRKNPFFLPFSNREVIESCDGEIVKKGTAFNAELLAYTIPAESFAAGANPIAGISSINMATEYLGDASHLDKDDRPWVHSTFVQRSYMRTKGLYHKIVENM